MKRRSKIIGVLVCLASIGGGVAYYYRQRLNKQAELPAYNPVTVARGDVVLSVQATGTVQPENRLVIKPPINGRMDSIKIREGESVRKGQVLGLMSSTDRAALLDVARSKGADEVRHWEELYRATPIIAPMAGVVIAKSVEPGQTIATQDQIFVMSDRLTIVAQVDETDMAKIRLQQVAALTLDAYSADKIMGHVHQIAFEARTVNNVTIYDVQILPDSVPDFMRSGMTAGVQFLIEERRNVLVLPATAVKRADERAYVLVPGDGEAAKDPNVSKERGASLAPREVDIKLGLSDGKTVEILEGLREGDQILEEVLRLPTAERAGNPFGGPGAAPKSGGRERK